MERADMFTFNIIITAKSIRGLLEGLQACDKRIHEGGAYLNFSAFEHDVKMGPSNVTDEGLYRRLHEERKRAGSGL